MLADWAYDANLLRNFIVEQGSEPMLPRRRNCKVPVAPDRAHNIVEREIGWLKQRRRPATHYEKIASSYLGLVMFVAVRHWLHNPFTANVHTP